MPLDPHSHLLTPIIFCFQVQFFTTHLLNATKTNKKNQIVGEDLDLDIYEDLDSRFLFFLLQIHNCTTITKQDPNLERPFESEDLRSLVHSTKQWLHHDISFLMCLVLFILTRFKLHRVLFEVVSTLRRSNLWLLIKRDLKDKVYRVKYSSSSSSFLSLRCPKLHRFRNFSKLPCVYIQNEIYVL